MDKKKFEKTFWFYYLELEDEFLELEKTIPVDEHNFKTFSYKYLRLIESICAEIDVCFKRLMEFKGENGSSIGAYCEFAENNFSDFKNSEITLFASKYEDKKIYPFKNWGFNNPPHWWTVYNKLKHHRDEMDNNNESEWYKHANQENVLNALAGLFQLNLYFYKEIISIDTFDDDFDVPLPSSQLFRLEDWGNYFEELVGRYPAKKQIENVIIQVFSYLSNLFDND